MKLLIAGLAAASALAAVAPAAQAQPYGHAYGHWRHEDGYRHRGYSDYGQRRWRHWHRWHGGYGLRCHWRYGRQVCWR